RCRLLASWGGAALSRNTAGGPRPRRRTEEPTETTVERRDHCADMVVSALHRCVDASGKPARLGDASEVTNEGGVAWGDGECTRRGPGHSGRPGRRGECG